MLLATAQAFSEMIPELASQDLTVPMRVFMLLTALSLAPAFMVSLTSFIRIIVVMGILRHGLGLGQSPPNQVLIGLGLMMTMYTMGPVVTEMKTVAYEPFNSGELSWVDALDRASVPLKKFMVGQTRDKDLNMFMELQGIEISNSVETVPFRVLAPAFMISELTTAFTMGFLILIPFLVIDLAVAAGLMAIGMIVLPPPTVSLPIKILVFVLADGWHLVTGALMQSYGVGGGPL